MPRVVAINQPNYLPWPGYFSQMNLADVFVFYDDVQYTKNDWRNRNKIKTPQGVTWLTVPVRADNRLKSGQTIADVPIRDRSWIKDHLKNVEQFYSRSSFFGVYYRGFTRWLEAYPDFLADGNAWLTEKICWHLGIDVTVTRSSKMEGLSRDRNARLVEICRRNDATHYLSGPAARAYLDETKFHDAGIKVVWQRFNLRPYQQLWRDFEPALSIIDLLFNCGPTALDVIRKSEKTCVG